MNHWDYSAPGWSRIPPGYSQPQAAHDGYWQQPAWTEPKESFFHGTFLAFFCNAISIGKNKSAPTLSHYTRSDICPSASTADRFTSKSRKHPSLHPILAADTTLARVDVRFHPSTEAAIQNATYYAYRHAHATATQASHLRLISKDFPWSVDIKTAGHPVTCDDVWNALYAALQQPLADSEWGALAHDLSRAKKVQKAARQRQSEGDKDKGLKRVDWVADNFIFRGLERDDDFAKRRLAYVDSECEETWVVRLVAQ